MSTLVQSLVWLSMLWAVSALAVELILAGRGRTRDFSRRAGHPGEGVFYNFTGAMVPARKESARRHPGEFALGVILHAGALPALASIPVLLLWPEMAQRTALVLRPLFVLSFAAGLFLFFRRLISRNLRFMSAPDDYLAILATCGLLAVAFLCGPGSGNHLPLMICAVVLFLYLPLGKLKHMVFFFAARADYGYRLGYRGVYPPGRGFPEKPDVTRYPPDQGLAEKTDVARG